jgi:hypothetical protein
MSYPKVTAERAQELQSIRAGLEAWNSKHE